MCIRDAICYNIKTKKLQKRKEMENMKKVWALVLTILAGILGLYIGAMLNAEGYFGSVFAIAVMGYFVIDAIEQKK